MKKTILTVAVIAGFAMTSCKKDYTCECVTKDNGTVVSTVSTTINTTKSKAKDACSGKATASSGGSTISMECSIK
ncbi:MAG: hypothetical protein IT236_08015 [Bacteroidia bacterium]|nr:hypothetical protein [Bacteroidia bacterium]